MIFFFGNFSGTNGGVQWFLPPLFVILTLLSNGLIVGPTSWLLLTAAAGFAAWQVRLHGFWPTMRRFFLTGWQGGTGNAQQRGAAQQGAAQHAAPQRRQTRQQRFEEVAGVVQSLPMEDFVTRDDLQCCSLHELREKLRQRGVKEVGLERNEAVERVLAADGGTTSSASCSICCEDYTSGEVLRRLPCKHKFHLECIDRWFLSSTDYSRPVACPMCNAPLLS
ncbi:g9601 [Coccomyxa elongata]